MLDVATWVKTVEHINEFEGCEAEVVFTCSDKQLNAPSNVTLLMLPKIRYVYYFSYLAHPYNLVFTKSTRSSRGLCTLTTHHL